MGHTDVLIPPTPKKTHRNHYNKAATAIVDSGTSLLVGPVDDVKLIAQVWYGAVLCWVDWVGCCFWLWVQSIQ